MRKKRKISGSGTVFLFYTGALFALFLIFGIGLLGQLWEKQIRYQSVVSLEGWDPGEDPEELEEELKKIRGFYSFTPVLEIPVKLRAEGYTMDAVFTGTELEALEKQVSRSKEVPLGNRPVLLLGEESLAAMTDRNGHAISEEKQKELLERFEKVDWQYCLDSGGGQTEIWNSCLAAGTLSFPSGEIYIPYSQAEALAGTGGASRFLLTVRGKENYERAAAYFEPEGSGSFEGDSRIHTEE